MEDLADEIQTAEKAARYDVLAGMLCGGQGQQLVEEIAVEGVQPTRKQLDARMDRIIASRGRMRA